MNAKLHDAANDAGRIFFRHRNEKINKLCSVMGVQSGYDPDRAYELTTDNVKKILAIHMRFR